MIDLRSRVEPDLVELILVRAEFLDTRDRALIDAYFHRGIGIGAIAVIDGRRPQVIRRRIRALCDHVRTDLFEYVMRSRNRFGTTRGRVAEAVYLKGQSRRAAAATLGISHHSVRRHCEAIEELARSAAEARAEGGGRRRAKRPAALRQQSLEPKPMERQPIESQPMEPAAIQPACGVAA